jgi:hypothetical protein
MSLERRFKTQALGQPKSKYHLSATAGSVFLSPLDASVLAVWPDRQSNSSWQIWIRYKRSMLKQLFRISPPTDANEKLQRIEQTVARFLVSKEARQIQWITVKEAHERLPR